MEYSCPSLFLIWSVCQMKMLESYIIILYKGDNFKHIFRRLMVDKRKSLSKCPYWCRRSRRSTPDLLFPYFTYVPSPMSAVQTMPVYSTSRSGSSLNNASPFLSGYSSFADSIAPFDLSLVPPNFGLSHTKSDVVEDLSIRSSTQSAFPSWMDWCGPSGASTSYITPIQPDPIIPTSINPCSDVQRFYQDFRLPNYTLDTFSGTLFDVVSSTTFITSNVQTEFHHVITTLIVFVYVFKFWIFLSKYTISKVLNFDCNFSFCVQIIWHIHTRGASFYWPWSQLGQSITSARSFSLSMWNNQGRYTMVKDQFIVHILCLFYL